MAHYEMRYNKRQLTDEEAYGILSKAEYCVISTVDADGTPYGVPISHVVYEGIVYIHCSNTYGHKLDAFQHDARVCLTTVESATPCFEKTFFTTRYESSIAFGKIRQITDTVEVKKALVALCMKYLPEHKHEIGAAIERELSQTAVWAVDIDEITGKASRQIGDMM